MRRAGSRLALFGTTAVVGLLASNGLASAGHPIKAEVGGLMDRAIVTANYALGPGINVDGEVAYTWLDTDPETADGVDDDAAVEVGIGTSIVFQPPTG